MQAPENQDRDAPHAAHPTGPGRVLGAWNLLVDGLGALGTLMIVALMTIICADVLVRNTYGASLPMVAEAGALTLVMIVYLQLATTVRHERLSRTDLFHGGLCARFPRVGAILSALFHLVAAGMLGVIAWSTVTIVERDFLRGEHIGVTGVVTLPTWPFRALILLGMTVATIQCIILLLGALREAARPAGGKR